MTENVIFYNAALDWSRSAVSRHLHYLLNGLEPLPGMDDAKLVELYNEWRTVCRDLNDDLRKKAEKPMIQMPPDDLEHRACRRMAAVIIERTVWNELAAERYLRPAVKQLKASNYATHAASCACHQLEGWTGRNEKIVEELVHVSEGAHYRKVPKLGAPSAPLQQLEDVTLVTQVKPSERSEGALNFGTSRYMHDTTKCACGACHNIRVMNGTADAYSKACRDASAAVLRRGCSPDLGRNTELELIKNLFQTVQGVAYDSQCPHGMPFYACMNCSH